MIKMPQGANTDTIKVDGAKPNQKFEICFAQNHSSQPFFQKIPHLRTLKQILHNLKWKAKKNVEKHTFEEIL